MMSAAKDATSSITISEEIIYLPFGRRMTRETAHVRRGTPDLRYGVEPSVHVLVGRVFLLRRPPTLWGVSVFHAGR
jgi:hypothetical protein